MLLSGYLIVRGFRRHLGWSLQQTQRLLYSSTSSPAEEADSICELAASNLRYGPGATAEVGQDMREHFHCRHVVLFTDSFIRHHLPCFDVVCESLERSQVPFTVYDQVRVEPNDQSFRHAIRFLQKECPDYDGVVALGGGSVIDTAKAANLYACHPPMSKNDDDDGFYTYVNPPIGQGQPIPGHVHPLVAIATTAGTGSETTGVAIFDDTPTRSKTGIAHRHLKPALGILDPRNIESLPASVATYSGLDVLCHALESYTALPYNKRQPKPSSPLLRPAYQGSNPISDVWSLHALQTAAVQLPRAVLLDNDMTAKSQMLLASAAAGLGFGNAGVHLCHGMSYPISSQVKPTYTTPAGYNNNNMNSSTDHALIPHGLSVIVAAPAVFSWTGGGGAAVTNDDDRHETAARILQTARWQREGTRKGTQSTTTTTTTTRRRSGHAGLWLADEIRHLCQVLQVPLGLRQFGYAAADIPALVEGTIPQHRVTKISPRPVQRQDLEDLFWAALDDE